MGRRVRAHTIWLGIIVIDQHAIRPNILEARSNRSSRTRLPFSALSKCHSDRDRRISTFCAGNTRCFAEFILSSIEGLNMTPGLICRLRHIPNVKNRRRKRKNRKFSLLQKPHQQVRCRSAPSGPDCRVPRLRFQMPDSRLQTLSKSDSKFEICNLSVARAPRLELASPGVSKRRHCMRTA